MGDVIMQDVENTLFRYYPDYKITVQLVWNPKWNPDMATEEGKLALTEF
jgi:metal-sulfur cluster biosynthetic enzyme